MPDAVRVDGATTPFFVSARSLMDSEGRVNLAVLTEPISRQAMQIALDQRRRENLADGGGDCSTRTISFPDPGSANRSVNDLGATSEAIYRGRVVGAVPGFAFTSPATLIAVQIADAPRSAVRFPRRGIFYFVYPAADFKLGDVRFCGASIHGLIPSVGDEIAVFASEAPVDAERIVLPIGVNQIAFSSGGSIHLPPALQSDREATSAKTVGELTKRAAEIPRRQRDEAQR